MKIPLLMQMSVVAVRPMGMGMGFLFMRVLMDMRTFLAAGMCMPVV